MSVFEVEPPRARELVAAALARAPAETAAWLQHGLPRPGQPFARPAFFGFYAAAGRRLREGLEGLDEAERRRLLEAGIEAPEVWSTADLARAALLLCACAALPEPEHGALVTEAYRKGDGDERRALLRCLALLPAPERFVPLAVEACRTHEVPVFAAIACDNPFPARHFPEPNFNQLVIKTLFLELPLGRVIDWRRRVGPELVRMARDYAAERRAAGRPVSDDLAMLTSAQEAP